MSSKNSSSLKELKGLREAVIAEEKAKTQARLQNFPPAASSLASEEPSLSSPASLDQQNESSEEPSTPPPSSPPNLQAAPLSPGRPAAARIPATAGNRNKGAPEPALIIPLTPKIQERLQKHVENTRWSPADLVIELIRAFLHRGYPEIRFGEQLIARAGSYRTFERNPLDAALKIVSGQGVFNVTIKPENSEYHNWLSYFTNQKAGDPEKSAQQVCLFALQTYLEGVEDFKIQGWIKDIPIISYSVAPMT